MEEIITMASVTVFSNKKVLIIDDMSDVRVQLQLTLSSVGFEKLNHVATIKEAMDKISITEYDIIMCDYNLGKATNGQQFLEFMRTNKKIKRSNIFVMVTAENSYEKVIAAAEHMPDDYLLKPFTAAHFINRLEVIIDRQVALAKVNEAHDQKNWTLTISECDKLIANKSKYYIEVCKVKADAYMQADMFDEAAEVYEHILSIRELPWAQLGFARAKARLGFIEDSYELVAKLIEDNPQYLAGFDFASDLLLHQNKIDEAMVVIQKAMQKNPDNLNRSRSYAGICLSKNEYLDAERTMSETITKHRYSPVREASDYGMLSRALLEQGRAKEAISALDEAKGIFKDDISQTVLSANSSIAWLRYGDTDRANEELNKALTNDYRNLPNNATTSLAEACFAAGKEEQANNMLRHLLQNNPEDLKLQGRIKMVQLMSGKTLEESNKLIQDSATELIKINNEGVLKAKQGRYEEAVELILGAAERMPDNLNIISNAALILAVSLKKMTFNQVLLDKAIMYRQRVFEMNQNHKKLPQIDATLAQLKEAI
jgi:tetratricopeptide (TPR) repeat protein